MDRLIELAERCEKASGADRELFLSIAKAAGIVPDNAFCHSDGSHWWANGKDWGRIPDYFGSLDAAMSLANGERWSITAAGGGSSWQAAMWPDPEAGGYFDWRTAATPALALCAAALRARASIEGNPTA